VRFSATSAAGEGPAVSLIGNDRCAPSRAT
jgi:hypothetical protein